MDLGAENNKTEAILNQAFNKRTSLAEAWIIVANSFKEHDKLIVLYHLAQTKAPKLSSCCKSFNTKVVTKTFIASKPESCQS